MARRSDHTRDELHAMALAAAREIAEADGLQGVTARRVAARIGYSAGTLYNLFDSLDDLIVRLNGETLDALYEDLSATRVAADPETALLDLARGYLAFTRKHPRLWSLVFEHRLPEGQPLPDWHAEKILRLLALLERAQAPLFGAGEEGARHHSARVLWSSLHGMVSLESAGKLVATETVEALVETLVVNFVSGLRNRAAAPTEA